MVETLTAPDLSDERLLGFKGGLRPCRHGGLRLESETLGSSLGGKMIVHNYGHGGCGVTIGFGCADEVVREVGRAAAAGETVAVLGAGVVGLTSAVRLLEAGYRVRVIAERLGTETVSAVAGALWLPTGIDEFTMGTERLGRFHGILRRSHDTLLALGTDHGVETLPVYEPISAPECPEYFDHGTLASPRPLDRLPIGAEGGPGRVFETMFIHTPRFLRSLIARVQALGGTFEHRRVERLGELATMPERVIVNCLAMGSRELFDDGAVYPARGMLVLMEPQRLGYIKHDGYRYMFPREDALILGGCFLEDDWRSEPDEGICRQILADHRAFWGQG